MVYGIIIAVLLLFLFIPNKKKPAVEQVHEPSRPPLTDAEKEAMRQAREAWDDETYYAISDGTYTGKLPEHVAFQLWTSIYPDLYHTSIAGINFRKGIKDLASKYFDCELVEDPKNKHDPNAIKIVHTESRRHLGFIPAIETDSVRKFVNNSFPYPCRGHIISREELNEDTERYHIYLIGEINIKRPKDQE